MNVYTWLQIAIYLVALVALAKPLGRFMANVFDGKSCGLDAVLGPVERLIYRVAGVRVTEEMNWKVYAGAMLLIFGLAFELPLVFVLLNMAGVLTHERFRKWRRLIIFAVFAFAAIATPSPDPLTMLLLAVPCVVFVELAEVFTWIHDRRKARRPEEVFAGLDGEMSEINLDEDADVSRR